MRPQDRAHHLALTAAAVVVCAGALPLAQAPPPAVRQPRITISTRPAPGTLPAPATPHTIARTVGGWDVRSWLDRTEAPDTIDVAPGNTIVLARDLNVNDRQYKAATSTLALVADSLTIAGNSTIDLSSPTPGRPAGTMLILARKIVCAPNASLQIVANGGRAVSRQGGGAGGSLIVAASDAGTKLPACISHSGAGGPATTSTVRTGSHGGVTVTPATPAGGTVRDHRRRPPGAAPAPPPAATETTITLPKGPDGTASAYADIRSASQNDPRARLAWSTWTIERLETLRVAIYEASRRRDDRKVLALFKEYEGLSLPEDAIDPDQRDRYLSVLDTLNSYRQTAVPALTVEDLLVQPGGMPQRVSVFTEGLTLKSYLAPTHALAVRASVQGRPALGLLEYRPERPDELSIETEWELSVDPWVERLAGEQIAKRGDRLEGMFAGWSLEAKPMEEMGVRSGTATLLPGGKRLRVRLVADANSANVVFWRLLNSSGLPWSVDWRFTEPKTGRTVTGTWAGPPLSLVRQLQAPVRIVDNQLENIGTSPVTVNYVRAADGSFVPLNPVVHLAPGQKAPLAAPSSASASGAGTPTIPPEAVETAFDPSRFGSDFYVLNGDQVLDRIIIRNALPPSDDMRGAFDYVEVTLETRVGGSEAEAVTAGPFRLSAAGTVAGEVSVPVLRLSQGARQVTLTGRAYYAGGSYRSLKKTTFDTAVIAITPDLLR